MCLPYLDYLYAGGRTGAGDFDPYLVKIEGVTYVNNDDEKYRFPRGNNVDGGIAPLNLELIDIYENEETLI